MFMFVLVHGALTDTTFSLKNVVNVEINIYTSYKNNVRNFMYLYLFFIIYLYKLEYIYIISLTGLNDQS